MTVDCGKQDKAALLPLDICRFDLVPNGAWRGPMGGTTPGSSNDISNPVVSLEGKWLAFQRGDSSGGEVGEGSGLYLLRLPD